MKLSLSLTVVLFVGSSSWFANAFSPQLTLRRVVVPSQTASYRRIKSWAPQYATKPEQAEQEADTVSTPKPFLGSTEAKIWSQPIPYEKLTIGVLKETFPGENRVSQTPDSIRSLVKEGLTVAVQAGGTYLLASVCSFLRSKDRLIPPETHRPIVRPIIPVMLLTALYIHLQRAKKLALATPPLSKPVRLSCRASRYFPTRTFSPRFVLPATRKSPD
jgi:hypothetical protein